MKPLLYPDQRGQTRRPIDCSVTTGGGHALAIITVLPGLLPRHTRLTSHQRVTLYKHTGLLR
ncbi:hypothetical protein, partial [Methylovirgula sp. 4M-Z18]|uniref:hypothetical protein n=1 Tax=Methylovirgula sp. 4M-Z18 TaxID=2293567 RepID=UPI001AECF8E4